MGGKIVEEPVHYGPIALPGLVKVVGYLLVNLKAS
jgi:hypothetical protein